MPFKKMDKPPYPPRLWALVGFPGSGKTTFAVQLRGALLAIDADQRFSEVLNLTDNDVYQLSDTPSDNTDPERIAQLLEANMPGSNVRTIVVDSLTTIIAPLVTRALIDNDAGRNKNRMAGFKEKALTMRLLQDSTTKWGCDVLWIYHLQHGRDASANEQTTATVSKTELARLGRSLNMKLEVVQDGVQRGIKILWARRGRYYPEAPILWDATGKWAGMPEKIEAAAYDGLTSADQEARAQDAPVVFPDDETAIAWGFEQGCFAALQHARNAYDKLRRESGVTNGDLRELWIAAVQDRLAGNVTATPDDAPLPEQPSELDAFFPRDPEPETSATPPEIGPTEFYKRLGELKTAKLVAFDVEKKPPVSAEIAQAKLSGDWSQAKKALEAQAH